MRSAVKLLTAAVMIFGISSAVETASAAEPDAKNPFRVGAVIPKSGPYSQFGAFLEPALNIAVKQLNESGGILGRKVELLIRDDASNPGRALLAAKELVEEQKVHFLMPEVVSGMVLATLPYATEKKVLTISQGSSPEIGNSAKFPYSFQFGDLATERVPAMVKAMKKLGGKKVGVLVSTNPGTVALGDAMAADLVSKYQMELAGYKQFSVDAKDLTSLLQSLRDSGADIIAFSGPGRDSVRLVMTGMQTLGWNAKVVGEPSNITGDLTEQVPAAVHSQFYSIMYRVAVQLPNQKPGVAAFAKELKTYGPITNLPIALGTRDLMFLAKWAFETAQAQKGDTSSDSLRATLESIGSSNFPADYSLMLGNPRYRADDHSTRNVDYSKLWGLIRVGKTVDGTYEGEILE